MSHLLRLCTLAFTCLVPARSSAQTNPSWTANHPPFRVAANLYYVGSRDLASYLVATPQGLILINSNLASSPPQIRHNIETLGFHFRDIKILLISHAHADHAAGSAEILRLTGAKYMVMAGDAEVVESGGRSDFAYGDNPRQQYAPSLVDRILHDGDEVRLGGSVLVAHKTAGHTKGCTTWTLHVKEAGQTLNVVIVGSPNLNPGYKLRNNHLYPEIAQDYEAGFRVLEHLPCDIFLGAHGMYFGLEAKFQRMRSAAANPFADPEGYRAYIAERKAAFERALAAGH